eukprot:scaffold592074_cov42-Prasinocladus_malaysianus.AAC.1
MGCSQLIGACPLCFAVQYAAHRALSRGRSSMGSESRGSSRVNGDLKVTTSIDAIGSVAVSFEAA